MTAGTGSSSLAFSFRNSTTISILLFFFALTGIVMAQEQVIYRFQGGTDGYFPDAALLRDKAGNLYGTTVSGGTPKLCELNGCGTVFELFPPAKAGDAWTETVLYRFQGGRDGAYPGAPLIADGSGNLYGTTAGGGIDGQGTVFELLRPTSGGTWTHSVLHSFAGVPSGSGSGDGALPGALVFDAAGNLYGATDQGGYCFNSEGGPTCFGSVFKLAPPRHVGGAWTESVIYTFGQTGLSDPHGGLILDGQGNLYGTTYVGGIYPYFLGGVFKLTPPSGGEGAWTETTLFDFNSTDGGAPNASLVFDSAGNLYGTTLIGGTSGYGTAFELSPPASGSGSWTETVLHDFLTDGDGNSPLANLIFDKSGNLYGTDWWGGELGTYDGTVFQLSPPSSPGGSWTETTLHSFGSNNGSSSDGSQPEGGLIFGSDGTLYGTASEGGGAVTSNCTLDGYAWTCGVVFEVKP